MTATPTAHDHTAHNHSTHDRIAPPLHNRSIVGKRTANLTLETPPLGAAAAGLLAGVVALPDVARLLLGLPTAVLLGVGTIATAARLLAR